MMDKRANIILFGCLICSLLIALLFLIVVNITHKSCELIKLDTKEHRKSVLLDFHNDLSPKRTRDKRTMIKMVAHLEYDLELSEEMEEEEDNMSNQSASQVNKGVDDAKTTTKVIPMKTSQITEPIKLHNSRSNSSSIKNDNNNNGDPVENKQNSTRLSKARFMPMELTEIDMEVTDKKFQFKYLLNFNCSQITMLVNRGPDEVYVERMWVELKLHNKRHSKCEIDFTGPKNIMNIDLRRSSDKLARFYCDRELRFVCRHYNERHKSRPGIVLAQLVINGLEFETGNATGAVRHKSLEFQGSSRGECMSWAERSRAHLV